MVDFQRDPTNVEVEDVPSSSSISSMLLCITESEESDKRNAPLGLQSNPSSSHLHEKQNGSSGTISAFHNSPKQQNPTNNMLRNNSSGDDDEDDDDVATKKSITTLDGLLASGYTLQDVSRFQQEAMFDLQLLVTNDYSKQRSVGGMTTTKNNVKNRPSDNRSLALSFCGLSLKEETDEDKDVSHKTDSMTRALRGTAAIPCAPQEESASSSSTLSNVHEAAHDAHDGRAHDGVAADQPTSSSSSSNSASRMLDLQARLEQEARANLCALLSRSSSSNGRVPMPPSQRQQLLQLQHDILRGNQPLATTIAATIRRNQQQQSSTSGSSKTTRKPKQRLAKCA